MKTIRAKFRCNSAKKALGYVSGVGSAVVTEFSFTPVTSNDPDSENGKFYASTPMGQIVLGATKLDSEAFELGKDYFVDFTLAD